MKSVMPEAKRWTRVFAEGQLRRERLVADDRPRHQVGKQGHERREISEGLGRRRVAAIQVNDVGQRVESVEGDADGQHDAQHPERFGADQAPGAGSASPPRTCST